MKNELNEESIQRFSLPYVADTVNNIFTCTNRKQIYVPQHLESPENIRKA